MAKDKIIALTATSERPAETFSGYVMLIALLLVIVARRFRLLQPRPTMAAAWMPT